MENFFSLLFSQHSVKDSLDFFNSRGMPTKVENENRVFPTSDSSSSVLNVLMEYIKEGRVEVLTNSPVLEIKRAEEINEGSNTEGTKQIKSIILENGTEILAKSFIIATGGKSYPKTGSTGDGFVWLKKMGHNIIKPDSALVPLNIKNSWVKNLQGVTLPDIKISLYQDGKKIEAKRGKILFTHFGVSGPTVLNMSKKINELMPYGDVILSLDLLPEFDFSSLNTELQKLFKEHSNKKIKNSLGTLIGSALVPIVTELANVNGDTFNHSITRDERVRLMKVLKDVQMTVDSLLSPENAIVSSGGVDLKEVDFKTMSSKIFSNLYFTGDILNIDRPSGGFSLQICWTTGYVAGTWAVDESLTS